MENQQQSQARVSHCLICFCTALSDSNALYCNVQFNVHFQHVYEMRMKLDAFHSPEIVVNKKVSVVNC